MPCTFGYAVVFPDCTYSGPTPPGTENSIVLSAIDLPHFERRIPEIFKKWCRKNKIQPLSKQTLDGIVKGLSPTFRLLPVLFRRIEEQEERLFRLTEDQMRLLDYLQNHKRAAIEGVAGSGKTLLAKAQAQRFANQGLDTLMVCYNRALAEWLRAILPIQYRDKITIMNFHRLCKKLCVDAGIEFEAHSGFEDDFWKNEVPYLFIEAIEKTDKRYDAIVVDEGQDFFYDWWCPLEMLSRDKDGPFYLFYDPAQNLFVGDDFKIPDLGEPYILPTNCRNTQRIAKACSQIRGIDIPVRDDAPEGDEAIIHVAETSDKQSNLCQKYITDWLGSGKLKPAQIAIQCPRIKNNSSLSNLHTIGKVPIIESLVEWKANKGVLFSTIRSFKGLEADAVVIVDVPQPYSLRYFSIADFYVACSRAKHLLVILPFSKGVLK